MSARPHPSPHRRTPPSPWLMCAGAMGSLHAPPALCAAIGSFLAAGGGWLSPSSVVGAGAARLGADMAARLFPFSDTSVCENE